MFKCSQLLLSKGKKSKRPVRSHHYAIQIHLAFLYHNQCGEGSEWWRPTRSSQESIDNCRAVNKTIKQ